MLVVSSYARAGGLAYGFANDSDYEMAFIAEDEEKYFPTLDENYSGIPIYQNFGWMKMASISNLCANRHIDVFTGCPKSNRFTAFYDAEDDKHRDKDVVHWLNFVRKHRPTVLVFPIHVRTDIARSLKTTLGSVGYSVEWDDFPLTHFGLPVLHKKTLCIAVQGKKTNVEIPPAPKILTIGDAIGDLDGLNDYRCDSMNDYQRWCRRYKQFRFKTYNVTPSERKECVESSNSMDGQLSYLNRNCNRTNLPSNIHPTERRVFNSREIMRMYGYPDSYAMRFVRYNLNDYVISDFPPRASYHIAEYIKQFF